MKKKSAKIEFKLEEDLFQKYKSLCEKNGYDMSKRLRIYIQKEIDNGSSNLYQEIIVDKIRYKPQSTLSEVMIEGIDFLQVQKSPNVFVIETKDVITNINITFQVGKLKYTIKDIHLIKSEGDMKVVECRYWSEEYVG